MNSSANADASKPGLLASREFTLWALAALQFRVETDDDKVYTLHAPEGHSELFNGAAWIRFGFENRSAGERGGGLENALPNSRMFQWMLGRLAACGPAVHAAPMNQPTSVHQVAERLFASYEVEGGSVHLAGCVLEDRPLVRLTYLVPMDNGDAEPAPPQVRHLYLTTDGDPVDEKLAEQLNFERLLPIGNQVPKCDEAELTLWIRAAQARAREQFPDASSKMILATIIWCKHVQGKLAFTIGSATAELPFQGWAQCLCTGAQTPPPFVCPETGAEGYRVVATDDGRMTVDSAIGVCDQSGRRVLRTDLHECSATGQRVLEEFLAVCPVAQKKVLQSALVSCSMCRQAVSPLSIRNERCAACRGIRAVSKDEPRMARVLGEYPNLDRWRKWSMAETDRVYILIASAFTQRMLIVVDKETLDVVHSARSGRLLGRWSPMTDAERTEYFER